MDNMMAFFFMILLLSCTNKEQKAVEKNSSSQREKISTQTIPNDSCGPVAHEKLADWRMETGEVFYVCSFSDAKKVGENEYEGWINIFRRSGETLTPLISEVDSELPSEFYTFSIKKVDGSKIKITRHLHSTMEEIVPITQTFITCDKKSCQTGKEECLEAKTLTVDRDAIRQIEDVRDNKVRVSELEYYDTVVGKVINSALAGDKKALGIVYGSYTEKNNLHLDGASAEVFNDGKHIIDHLIKVGCLKNSSN